MSAPKDQPSNEPSDLDFTLRLEDDDVAFLEQLEADMFEDQLTGALRDRQDLPDLTERILRSTQRRRGFLSNRARRMLSFARYAVAAGLIAAAGLVFITRSTAPTVHPANEAPISALAEALPAEAQLMVEQVQLVITAPADRAPRALTIRDELDSPLALVRTLEADYAEVAQPPVSSSASTQLLRAADLAELRLLGGSSAPIDTLQPLLSSSPTSSVLGLELPAAPANLIPAFDPSTNSPIRLGTRWFMRDPQTGHLIELHARPVPPAPSAPASLELRSVLNPANN